jgi:hypothetical protein
MKKTILAILTVGTIMFTACSKEETTVTPTDVRDQAVGNYNSKTVFNYLVSGELIPFDSSTATLKLEKGTSSTTILIKETNGKLITTGSKIAAASNGFTFDIDPQTVDTITLEGYNYFILGSTKYHGGFISGSKKLTFAYKTLLAGSDYIIITECTKQ